MSTDPNARLAAMQAAAGLPVSDPQPQPFEPLRHVLAAGAVQADVAEVLALLARLEVPVDWGRDRVKARLTEAGEKRGNDLLTAAIRERKRAADLSADRSDDDDEPLDLLDGQDSEGSGW